LGEALMRIVGTIEARMGSSRSPGKTLVEIHNGMSLLELVYSRFKLCKNVDEVYVATTDKEKDQPIASWCEKNNAKYYRGSEDDVLDRVTKTAIHAEADAIVQMGADSAYLDYELIDQLIEIYKKDDYDYVCNDLELTYPLGIYGHVVRVSKLIELNNKQGLSAQDREDVVRYFWEHPEPYRILSITAPPEFLFPQIRLTVDYAEDIQLAREICSRFNGFNFRTSDIIALYKKEPELFDKTKNLVQKSAPFIKRMPVE
jgi:spore coat polysaccharide biosynthesis protein SpsF